MPIFVESPPHHAPFSGRGGTREGTRAGLMDHGPAKARAVAEVCACAPQRRKAGVREGYLRAPECWSAAGRAGAHPHLRTSRASNCPVKGYGPSMHFFRRTEIPQ